MLKQSCRALEKKDDFIVSYRKILHFGLFVIVFSLFVIVFGVRKSSSIIPCFLCEYHGSSLCGALVSEWYGSDLHAVLLG